MRKLLIASKNPGKVNEYKTFLADLDVAVISLLDLKVQEDIEENEETYKKNSQNKARFFANLTNIPTIADDGGIEIFALGNAPGVRTRRWLGEEATEEDLILHMMKISKELPDDHRGARFCLVLSFAMPKGMIRSVEGSVEGIIAKKPLLKILKGFPFRSFFYLPEIQKYYHESDLSPLEMGKYNHRFIATQKLKPIIIQAFKRFE